MSVNQAGPNAPSPLVNLNFCVRGWPSTAVRRQHWLIARNYGVYRNDTRLHDQFYVLLESLSGILLQLGPEI